MKWEDQGILLSSRSHGEHNAIIEVLTMGHGRHAGLVKGAYTQRTANVLQPGMQLNLVWSARLNEHLGVFFVEKVKSRTFALIKNKLTLLGFNSLISVLLFSLPEREPCEKIYNSTLELVDKMGNHDDWLISYVHWELLILTELGFGLDLSECAVTGNNKNLIYVSPKTGRAVSAEAGRLWEKKLLDLPQFLISPEKEIDLDLSNISIGMRLTGHFLKKWLLNNLDKNTLPSARHRFFSSLTV